MLCDPKPLWQRQHATSRSSPLGAGQGAGPGPWETTNLLHIGQLLTLMAALRQETRGGHLRSDFPERDDDHWQGHTHTERHPDGSVTTTFHPVPPQDLS